MSRTGRAVGRPAGRSELAGATPLRPSTPLLDGDTQTGGEKLQATALDRRRFRLAAPLRRQHGSSDTDWRRMQLIAAAGIPNCRHTSREDQNDKNGGGKKTFRAWRGEWVAETTKARRGRDAPGFDSDRQLGRRSAVRRTEAARRGKRFGPSRGNAAMRQIQAWRLPGMSQTRGQAHAAFSRT